MRFYPQTLLWRTFLLVAALILLSMLAWFEILTVYEREPRARQAAQLVVSVVNLTRTALLTARVDARRQLLQELSDQEGIHIYPAEAADRIQPLPDRAFVKRMAVLVRERLGPETRITLEREGEEALFVSFRLDANDDGEEDEFWLAMPQERLDRVIPMEWMGWAGAALLLSLAGAWLIMFRVTRPLKALDAAAEEIGRGGHPPPVPERGPEEIRTLARTFNRMAADLARLEEDRALILAGVSHDLRTPLTRLRMGIELAAEQSMQEGMIADVEEMDRTIGQFLDFARAEGGEGASETDVAALLTDLAEQYRKRGAAIETRLEAMPPLVARPQALRRAVANLIENALRHAGRDKPLELTGGTAGNDEWMEVGDRGPGIPAEEVERLKLPFTRRQAARTGAVGAGLGLAIVDRIARSHGGRLDLLPRDGGGLKARITIPRP